MLARSSRQSWGEERKRRGRGVELTRRGLKIFLGGKNIERVGSILISLGENSNKLFKEEDILQE